MKIKFTDFGRCLICLKNPCKCSKTPKENPMKDKLQALKQALEENKEAFEAFDGDCSDDIPTVKVCKGIDCNSYKCLMVRLDAKIKALN